MTTEPFLFYHSKRQVSGTMKPLKASWLKGLMKNWRNHVPQFIFICTYIFISIYNYHTQSMFVQIKHIKTFDMKRTISIKSYFSHAQFKEMSTDKCKSCQIPDSSNKASTHQVCPSSFWGLHKRAHQGLAKMRFQGLPGKFNCSIADTHRKICWSLGEKVWT